MNAERIELAKKNGTLGKIKSRLVDEKIREKYSISEQIALLRQRDEKPDEYTAFYEYAEACKAEVQAYLDNPPTDVDMGNVMTIAEYEAKVEAEKAERETALEVEQETEVTEETEEMPEEVDMTEGEETDTEEV